MPCRPTIRRWLHSASSSPNSGNDRSGDAVRKTARRGSRSRSWPKIGSRNRIPFIHGQEYASPSPTQGGSRMRESRTYGSVRGALSNERPYRDHQRCEYEAHRVEEGAGLTPVDELGCARYDAVRKLFCHHVQGSEWLEKLAIAVTKGHLLAVPEGVVEVLAVVDRGD